MCGDSGFVYKACETCLSTKLWAKGFKPRLLRTRKRRRGWGGERGGIKRQNSKTEIFDKPFDPKKNLKLRVSFVRDTIYRIQRIRGFWVVKTVCSEIKKGRGQKISISSFLRLNRFLSVHSLSHIEKK